MLVAVLEATAKGLIAPILVGPAAKIEEVAKKSGLTLGQTRIVDAAHSHDAAKKAVELIRQGEAEVLMKGSLHTDELLSAVVARETGLRTARRISHVFIMDVPTYHKVLIITDAAINIAPTLEEKADICQNAIDLAISLGVSTPKVAILAAVETVNSKMPATIDAAALCKMADRGQIKGGLLDGPLAFDNAISREAARVEGNHLEGRRRCRHPARSGPRGRQHARQAAQLPGERGQRRSRARRSRADHPDESRRQRSLDRQLHRQLRDRENKAQRRNARSGRKRVHTEERSNGGNGDDNSIRIGRPPARRAGTLSRGRLCNAFGSVVSDVSRLYRSLQSKRLKSTWTTTPSY